MSRKTGLAAEKRQLVYNVGRKPLRTVVGRAAAVGAEVEGLLRNRDFAARRGIESIGGTVDERAPGVVGAGSQAIGEPPVVTDLQRVVDGRSGVGAQPDDAQRRIYKIGRASCRERVEGA